MKVLVHFEHDGGANPQLLPRMHQGIPLLPREAGQEQTLDRAPTRHARTEQPRWKYPGVVDDKQVARCQQLG